MKKEIEIKKFEACICRQSGTTERVQNKVFDLTELKQANIYNDVCYKRDGSFKKFWLMCSLHFKNGESWTLGKYDAAELKKILRGLASEVRKSYDFQYKNGNERKAVNYTYYFN